MPTDNNLTLESVFAMAVAKDQGVSIQTPIDRMGKVYSLKTYMSTVVSFASQLMEIDAATRPKDAQPLTFEKALELARKEAEIATKSQII